VAGRQRTLENVVKSKGEGDVADKLITGFHHLAIHVKDLEASLKFYTEALGFRVTRSWGQKGSRQTVLLDVGDGNYLEMSSGGPQEPKPEGAFIHLALRTTDTRAAIERVRAAGAEVTTEPKDVVISAEPPIPVRLAFFKGPDGEVIELFEQDET
jgi:glyoxylase I family protein